MPSATLKIKDTLHTLQTRQINSSHTAENLAEVLTNAVEEWGLKKSQPVAITTDNASNIVSKSNISSEFSPHIRCFANTLNLATQRAINCQQVDRVAGRIRRIVSFFTEVPQLQLLWHQNRCCLNFQNTN